MASIFLINYSLHFFIYLFRLFCFILSVHMYQVTDGFFIELFIILGECKGTPSREFVSNNNNNNQKKIIRQENSDDIMLISLSFLPPSSSPSSPCSCSSSSP
jgi:hypothetical protein